MDVAGAALLAGGRFHEAVAAFAQALQREPDSLAARIGLARAYAGTGDALSAAAWLSDAMRIAPSAVEPVQFLADLLLQQKRHSQALPLYERLLGPLAQRSAANLLHAGFCREQAGDIDAAAALYRQAIAADSALMEAHVDLAGVLWRLADFDGALAHATEAVRLAPSHPYAQRILGTALLNLNRVTEAQQALRRALELQPGFALAELDLAFAQLLAGELEEGFRRYEQRWRDPRLQRPAFFRAGCEWPGPAAALQGQAIAVYGEQGFGDVLQFVRYLPRLRALGATVCGVFHPALVPLIEASFPHVHCLAPGRELQVQWHAALMDLPARLGVSLDTVPSEVPYLRVPSAAQATWAARLRAFDARPRIGIAWRGSPAQINDCNRSLAFDTLRPLLATAGVQFFSLQLGDGKAATGDEAAHELVDLTGEWNDFTDSAALIDRLDLVITVDTAIAHLAGALGKPVWILLAPNADWRWLLDRDDSPWYPTARLFRRGFGEERAAQVARVAQALAGWLAAR